MRSQLLIAAALVTGLSAPMTAQTSDTRFTPTLMAGQRLAVSNIDGKVTVTQGRGWGAEIVVHKVVHKGNGALVKAILEETSNGYRVCTVYLENVGDTDGCDHREHRNRSGRDPLDVDMQFDVKLPAGVALTVNTVDGDVDARGIDTPANIRSVDGSITFEGVAPEGLHTVDGAITATITNADWGHALSVRTVDGKIDLTLPSKLNAKVSGQSVEGDITSDFALTVSGKWGPQSFHGEIGTGGGPSLELRTVDGSIRLRSSDGAKHGETQTEPARRRGRGRP